MAKYIIDIPDEKTYLYVNDEYSFLRMPIGLGENDNKTISAPTFLRIEPYTEPDRKVIEDEVWEFVRIITDMTEKQRIECFGGASCDLDEYWTYQDAKVKYEAWEKSKEEIHVGDEVTDNDLDEIGVVTYVYDSYCCILWSDGSVSEEVRKSELRSTGRHFNITHELLKKMRDAE